MDEVRREAYARYVSSFKKERAVPTPAQRAARLAWMRAKYLALLEGLVPDAPILEIGCGAGDLLDFLASCGFRKVHGIDLSQEQVDLARAQFRGRASRRVRVPLGASRELRGDRGD